MLTQVTVAFGIYSYTHNHEIESILYYLSPVLFICLFAGLEAWH